MQIILSLLTKEAAKNLAKKTAKNLDRRAERLVKRNLISDPIREVRDLKEGISTAKTRNDWVKLAGKAMRLDNTPLLRIATAPAEIKKRREKAARAAERARKDLLVERASDPNETRHMDTEELREANRIMRARLRGKANATKKHEGETFATRKLEEFLDESPAPKDATRNQLIRQVKRLNEISTFQGLTPQGARDLKERGVKILGEAYRSMTMSEQAAVWDAVHRYATVHSMKSAEAAAVMNESLNANGSPFAVAFEHHSDGRITAFLAKTKEEADVERYNARVRMKILRDKAKENERNGKKPLIGMI